LALGMSISSTWTSEATRVDLTCGRGDCAEVVAAE
jgi:hypothetical protein